MQQIVENVLLIGVTRPKCCIWHHHTLYYHATMSWWWNKVVWYLFIKQQM